MENPNTLLGESNSQSNLYSVLVSADETVATVTCHKKAMTQLNTRFNFRRYPFDSQHIELDFRGMGVGAQDKHCEFCYESKFQSEREKQAGMMRCLLAVEENLGEWEPLVAYGSFRSNDLRLHFYLKRDPSWHLWNTVFVVFLLCTMNFFVNKVSSDELGDRLALNFTLVLSVAAYKYSVFLGLPKLSYLTWLDSYMIVAFGLLFFACVENTIVDWLKDEDDRNILDLSWSFGAGFLWLVFHLCICIPHARDYFLGEDEVLESLDGMWQYK